MATNQLNLLFMLAGGLVTGPKGFGRKYYQDAMSVAPGWIPLFAGRIPVQAFEQSVSEGTHLRPVVAALHLGSLRGPVKALGADDVWHDRRFPEELDGNESVLLIPAPLPATWIQAIIFSSKDEQAAIREEAADYANVPLERYKQRVNKTLLQGTGAMNWPPAADLPEDRDTSTHTFSAVGAAQALLFALANKSDHLVAAANLVSDPFEITREKVTDPLLRALLRWSSVSEGFPGDEVQARMLLALLQAIVAARSRVDDAPQAEDCPPDIQQVVLDFLESQGETLQEPKQKEALARLAGDLRGLVGLGGETTSELLKRHPRPFSRGLILFFLRAKSRELLAFDQDLLTAEDWLVAAALFAARTGWLDVPVELMLVEGLLPAVSHRMAALAHRTLGTGIDLGDPPPRVKPLRELLKPADDGWDRRQKNAALALARGMGWQQALRTRITLGKGGYRLEVDGRGLHLLMEGDVKAVTTEIDQPEALRLLAESSVPLRLDGKLRSQLAT